MARQAADGLSDRTLRERERVLRSVEAFLGCKLRHASAGDIRRWWASTSKLAPVSRQAYLSHVRSYYVTSGRPDLTADIRRPHVRPGVPRPVSDTDLGMALQLLRGDMWTVVALMGVCGMRCVEVWRMRPADVVADDQGGTSVRVAGKGGRVRLVAVPDYVAAGLAGYSWPDVPSAGALSKRVARALRAHGIDATAHQLRHTAATRFYAGSGGDLLGTARYLGHASVSTTMIYAHTDTRAQRAVLEGLQH